MRLEKQYLYRVDLVGMSKFCVILHNINLKMSEDNLFESDDGEDFDAVQEFYTEYEPVVSVVVPDPLVQGLELVNIP